VRDLPPPQGGGHRGARGCPPGERESRDRQHEGAPAEAGAAPRGRAPSLVTGERIERDALGEVRVPADAYYGAETVRAAENFRISGRRPRSALIRALAEVKVAAARANGAIGALPHDVADAIARAAEEVAAGALSEEFLRDPYQA